MSRNHLFDIDEMIPAHELWEIVRGINAIRERLPETIVLSGHPVPVDAVGETIEMLNVRSMTLEVPDDAKIGGARPVGHVGETNYEATSIAVEDLLCPEPSMADAIAERIGDRLICGRMVDRGFERWQSERHPGSYERNGRTTDGLSIIPAYDDDDDDDLVVDISSNPGRTVTYCGTDGYEEAIGAVMWIGPRFAQRTGGDWTPLRQHDWCRIEELDHGLIKLTSWDGPFDSAEEPQAERQEILRRVLFPQSARSSYKFWRAN